MRMRFFEARRALCVLPAMALTVALSLSRPQPGCAQDSSITELSEEEQRQVQIAERFLTVLERNPRRGTALDRIYGHHVEFGTLDDFMESLQQRVTETPDDGTAWMLLGLFESHRGEDAAAIDAFQQAEKHRPDDALASYYLGQSQLLLGQPEAAVASFERAIERQPQRADLLEIFQQLGRIHQRAQRDEAALEVWTRLESLFPDDVRVQEQIAVVLVEEGEYALALPRYEKLAELVSDDYRRTIFQIEAAELKVREGHKDEGIADLETVLANLNPESWLHREVRRRIEDVFLRSGDQDGLVSYYEQWIDAHPEDVDAMARVAKFLASSARMPEAREWMEKALTLAPSRSELRKAFIDQLVDEQKYADALQQYELLEQSDPGNPDVLRDWGKLALKDKSRPQQEREEQAREIWSRILSHRPDDALTAAQVADLYRQAEMNDQAIALYQKAVTLAPADPQYREYLGEFYHILKRPDDALETWKQIAEGERRTAVNVARLAEVYHSFGYVEESVEQIAEAVRLEPKDFALQLRSAEYHMRAEKYDEALNFVETAGELAANDQERDAVITQRIEVLQASRQLTEQSEALAARLADSDDAGAEDWHLLARYYEAERRWASAGDAIGRAIEADSRSIPALTTAARIAESSGELSRAAELNRNLADVDRRARGNHLMNVARLEAQMGRTDEALQAGRDLIVSAPGNTDNYEFYAQLCFQLGRMEEGLDALRKAVRINPTEPGLIMSLGSALSRQFRNDEAIEVYWRAFERTDDVDEKTTLTQKLTDLYLQINQFDKLIERLERDRREEDQRRDMTICLAQAHHSAGDYGTARTELESLLSQQTRDTNLLQQISKLCEEGSDLESAIEYQRQLVAIAPGHETEFRLAGLLQQSGRSDEASEIFLKLTRREEDPVRLLRSIDSLLTQGSYESVLSIVDPLLADQRDDWELMYRQGVAWASLDRTDEAEDVMKRILALNIPYDSYGRAAEERFKREQAKAKSDTLRGIRSNQPKRISPLSMLSNSSQVRRAVGLDPNRNYAPSMRGPQRVWTPDIYGVARMAAFGWRMKFEQSRQHKSDEDSDDESASFIDQIARQAADEQATRNEIYDWMYIEQLRSNYDSLFAMAKRLAKEGGREEKMHFLQSLMTRNTSARSARQLSGNEPPQGKPLSGEEIELMLDCYEELAQQQENASPMAGFASGQIAYSSTGQAYVQIGGQWVMISSGLRGRAFLGPVLRELELAGRDQKAKEMVEKQIQSAQTSGELAAAVQLLQQRKDRDPQPEQIDALYDRWASVAIEEVNDPPQATGRRSRSRTSVNDPLAPNTNMLLTWMGRLGEEEENQQILEILDPALNVAVEVGKARRAERAKRRRPASAARAPSASSNWGMQYYYGTSSQYIQVTYPRPNDYVSNAPLQLLRATYEIFVRNEVVEDLPVFLEQRIARADNDSRMYEQLMLAYVLWWMERQGEALEVLTSIAEQLADDPGFKLELARVHQQRGDIDTAMDIVESIAPRDQRLMQQRELIAMTLAERLGEVERAQQAAERLFGLRLDTNEQLGLATAMRRLGLNEMAESVLARVHRRAGNQTASLPLLMAQYQGQGKVDLAQQIAHRILRTTQSPLSAMNQSSRNPLRYRSSNSPQPMREQALRLLHQTGALDEMVERLETQIARSPEAARLHEQLVEIYQATGQREQLAEALSNAVEASPDSAVLQFQLAQHYEQSGEREKACDAYLALLKIKPNWVADDLYRIRRMFEQTNRTLELAKAFDEIDISQLGQPHYLINLVGTLLNNEENVDIAADLFERIVEAYPNYRNQMISSVRDGKVWKNERIYNLGKQLIIPTESEVVSSPWFGVDNIYSYSANGKVNAMFHQMLNGVAQADRLDDFRQTIAEATERMPGWHGGRAMLALVDLKGDEKDVARANLEALVSDEEVMETMNSNTCWLIGQELDGHQQTRDLALKLFEKGAETPRSTTSQIKYSPVNRLVKLYSETGRKEDARELLQKRLRNAPRRSSNAQYEQAMQIQNTLWIAEQLQSLDFPLDALLHFQNLSTQQEGFEYASRYIGGSADRLKNQIDRGLQQALKAVGNSDPDQAVARLLEEPEQLRAGEPVFDLMLTVPSVSTDDAYADAQPDPMSSRFVSLLESITGNEAIEAEIQKRLESLGQSYADDVSIRITRAALATSEDRQAAVESLMETLQANPLDEIPDGRRPNSRQRRQARQVVPVWLVARQCLRDDEFQEAGEVLAEQALEAARRQLGTTHTSALLMEWGQIALETGDRDQAEARWSQLLEIVTERPTRRKNNSRPANRRQPPPRPPVQRGTSQLYGRELFRGRPTSLVYFEDESAEKAEAPPERTAPLTVSQFKVAGTIAARAATNGMPELSRRAVREMLAGGSPVPDAGSTPQQGSTLSRAGGMVVIGGTIAGQQPAGSNAEIEQLVVSTVTSIVKRWEGPDYPSQETYDLLLPLVLPPSRPTDVMLYADSSELDQARVADAGQVIIDWATKADALDDLNGRVRQRLERSQFKLPGLVLMANIALEAENFDAARESLEAIANDISQKALEPSATLACHAALPATEHPQLKAPAFDILQKAVKIRAQAAGASTSNPQNTQPSMGRLHRMINRYLAEQDKEHEVSAFFEDYLNSRQSYYSRYSGNYGLYIQWRDWAELAGEAAHVGAIETALDLMGRTVDFEHEQYSRPSLRESLAGVLREMETLPAQVRYERWRDWTLPTETRRNVRMVIAHVPINRTPEEFLPAGEASRFPQTGLSSNVLALLDAAEEAGQLPELQELAGTAREQKAFNAEFLLPLVLIRQGDVQAAAPLIAELTQSLTDRNTTHDGEPAPDIKRDYLIYYECLQSGRFAPLYLPHRSVLRKQLRNRGAINCLSQLDSDFARYQATATGADLMPGQDPQLVHWIPTTTNTLPQSAVDPWWAVCGDQLLHIGGYGEDSLYFRVPLTGSFEFAFDNVSDDWAEADAGYGGLVVYAQKWGAQMELISVGRHERLRVPQPLKRQRPGIEHVAVKVHDGRMSYWLNNHQVHEEPLSGTSPWLHLTTENSRQSTFRNLTLTGNPTIPEQVALIKGDRMDGWNTQYFGESQPKHRVMAQEVTDESDYYLRNDQENEPVEHDWSARQDVFIGRADRSASADAQSWTYYHRPLAEGETFSYEFEYRPGEAAAFPTLGRVAYLFRPDGVATHWIGNESWDQRVLGIPPGNEHEPIEFRLGDSPLPLEAGQWNRVTLSLKDGLVRLSLNDQPVFEGPAQPLPDTRFGLYRPKRLEARVRKATLRGPWQEHADLMESADLDLLARRVPSDDKSQRIIGQIAIEDHSALGVRSISERAGRLPDDEALAVLSDWVLPSPSHDSIRLYFDHAPFDSAAGAVAVKAAGVNTADPQEDSQPLDVGPIISPAVDLINLAARTGRLSDLRERVEKLTPQSPTDQRSQRALRALLSLAEGDDEQALEVIQQIDTGLAEGLEVPAQARPEQIAPEVLVSRAASDRPRLALAAASLAQRLVDDARQNSRPSNWHQMAVATHGFASDRLAGVEVTGPAAKETLTQWHLVPYVKPQHRFDGHHPSQWRYTRGRVEHVPSLTWGQLIFQSPLRGSFEVVAERSLFGYRELSISYGMHAAAPKHDLQAIQVTKVMHGQSEVKDVPELPELDWKADFRLAIEDSHQVRTFVEGTEIHQMKVNRPFAPWLMLQADSIVNRSIVRNLRILGDPEIPDEIDLLDAWSSGFWRANAYVGWLSGDGSDENAPWRPAGVEMIGKKITNRSVEHLESLLFYQRPMLEDGVISFEAFYEPGELEVHPALGRSALLLRPDGVTRHELTDAEYERHGRMPDNESSIPGAADSVPLKENAWNAVTLTLRGDELSISVNGETVATHTVTKPGPERFFGLFRYGNRTGARVRNIKWRGEWPKQLPSVDQQQLAYPPEGVLALADGYWTDSRTVDLAQSLEQIEGRGLSHRSGESDLAATDDGLRMSLNTTQQKSQSASVGVDGSIEGDCEIAVDFKNLNLTPVAEGWGNSVSLKLHFDDPASSWVGVELMLTDKGQPMMKVGHSYHFPNGEFRHDMFGTRQLPSAGRLRLVRIGGTVYGLVAEDGSDDFRFVGSVAAGTVPITRAEVSADSADQQATVDVVLKSLTINTKSPTDQLSRRDE